MAIVEQKHIWIKGNENALQEGGVFSITSYDPRDRLIRAAKACGICWALAVLALVTFIPVVHLLAAAGLFIAGPIMGYSRYRSLSTANDVSGVCPSCRKDITLKIQPEDSLPIWTYCPVCGAPLHLVAK